MKTHVMIALLLFMGWSCLSVIGQDDYNEDPLDDNADVVDFKYQPNPNRVRLKSVVTEDLAMRLKAGHTVSINVPLGKEQVISSLIVRKPEFFKSKLLSIRPRTRVVEENLLVPFPVELIDRLDYQPVELKIFQSNVKKATLVPVDDPDNDYSLASKSIVPDFFVRLKPNNGVAVAFDHGNSFRLRHELFDVNFPFDQIEAIFFEGGDSQASIVLKSGDTISGKHSWPQSLQFETPWGEEEIELEQINSITRDKSIKMVPSGIESPRFILIKQTNHYLPKQKKSAVQYGEKS